MNSTDLVIIGAGAAGMSAAIFASRQGLKTVVVSTDLGGQTNLAHVMENYPGIQEESGVRLMLIMATQVKKNGAEIVLQSVQNIARSGENWQVTTNHDVFSSKAVILAFGKTPSGLEIDNEKDFIGRGLCYSSQEEEGWWLDQNVAVVGSGNSAAEAIINHATKAKKIYWVVRGNQLKCNAINRRLIDLLPNNLNLLFNHRIMAINGKETIEGITVIAGDNKKTKLRVSGILSATGYRWQSEWLPENLIRDQSDRIVVDNDQRTNLPGLFAAGDVTDTNYQQTIIAAGDGAKAGLTAARYLGCRLANLDWGKDK